MKTPGDIFAAPAQLVATIPSDRAPLLVDPPHEEGWFGGQTIAAWDPVVCERGLTLEQAAEYLDAAYDGSGHELVSVLAEYDGRCTLACYDGFASWDGATWKPTGSIDDGPLGQAAGAHPPNIPDGTTPLIVDAHSEMDAAAYIAAIGKIQDAIRAGDVYLVNMTYRIMGRRAFPPGETYASLVSRASSMMNAFFSDGQTSIASVSPERFLSLEASNRVDDDCGIAEIWPIKGTRPRAESPDQDARNAAELRSSQKERAEHVMVVDLERNDLGRVSRTGSVFVDPLMDVAQTPYCHQMYSTVKGIVEGERPVARLLGATFPCGSVTGTPKIAAMGTIGSLELSPRGPYTGSLIVAMRDRLDSSVLIRTLVDDGVHAEWGTGGGITIESDPHEEWLETLLKARPVLGTEG